MNLIFKQNNLLLLMNCKTYIKLPIQAGDGIPTEFIALASQLNKLFLLYVTRCAEWFEYFISSSLNRVTLPESTNLLNSLLTFSTTFL